MHAHRTCTFADPVDFVLQHHSEESVFSVCVALRRFLRCLAEPVLTTRLCAELLQIGSVLKS